MMLPIDTKLLQHKPDHLTPRNPVRYDAPAGRSGAARVRIMATGWFRLLWQTVSWRVSAP